MTATAAGLGFGAWSELPADVSRSLFEASVQPIDADDPNLARYKQVIAAEGIAPGPPVYVAASYRPPAVERQPGDEASRLDAELAQQSAAFDEQAKRWEAERVAWLAAFQAEQRARQPMPAAYLQPETVTAAEADDLEPAQPTPW